MRFPRGRRRRSGHHSDLYGDDEARALGYTPLGGYRRDPHAKTIQIARRRGQRIAVVALARRLAGILYAMWCDEVAYDAHRIRPLPRVVYQRVGGTPHDPA